MSSERWPGNVTSIHLCVCVCVCVGQPTRYISDCSFLMLSSEGFKRRKKPSSWLRACAQFQRQRDPGQIFLDLRLRDVDDDDIGCVFFFCMRFNFVSVSRVGLRMARIHLHKTCGGAPMFDRWTNNNGYLNVVFIRIGVLRTFFKIE